MTRACVALLLAMAAAAPLAATGQTLAPPACAETHYECSPGVCCPK
jgi:hypothetical protein